MRIALAGVLVHQHLHGRLLRGRRLLQVLHALHHVRLGGYDWIHERELMVALRRRRLSLALLLLLLRHLLHLGGVVLRRLGGRRRLRWMWIGWEVLDLLGRVIRSYHVHGLVGLVHRWRVDERLHRRGGE